MNGFKLAINGLSKTYGNLQVWQNLNLLLHSGHAYCLMGASGSGKTTLLRILLGLEEADRGTVTRIPTSSDSNDSGVSANAVILPFTAVFQEDRLCETFSPLDNVMLAADPSLSRQTVFQELCRLLPEESLLRPASTLSGGMKRRVAIVRAMLAPSAGILMDEPFTGLDEETRHLVISYINEKIGDRLLLVATHQEEDIAALHAELVRLH